MNNIVDPGIYYQANADIPAHSPDGECNSVIIVMTARNTSDVFQLWFCANSRRLWMRQKYAGEWRTWVNPLNWN